MNNKSLNLYYERKISILFVSLLLSIVLISHSFASDDNIPITLEYFLKEAIANYPSFQSNKLDIKTAEAELLKRKSVSDTNLEIIAQRRRANPIPEAINNINTQNNYLVNISATRNLLFSGTRIKFGVGVLDMNRQYENPTFDEKLYMSTNANLQISQPLLKNWLGLIYRLPIEQARMNIVINAEKVKELDEFLINSFSKLFYGWALVFNKLVILRNNLENAQAQLIQTKKKQTSGLFDKVDLSKSEAQVIISRKKVLLNEALLNTIESEIKKYLTSKYKKYETIYPEFDINSKLTETELVFMPVENTRKLKILNNTKKVLEKEHKLMEESSKPELELMFSGKLNSFSENTSDITDVLDYSDYAISLSFLYPIGNSTAKGNTEIITTEIEILSNSIDEFILDYKFNIQRLTRLIQVYKDMIVEDENLTKVLKEQLDYEKKKYLQGRLDIFFIIETENKLLEVELDLLTDKITLLNLSSDFLDITDQLQNKPE